MGAEPWAIQLPVEELQGMRAMGHAPGGWPRGPWYTVNRNKNGYPFTTFTGFSDFLGIILGVEPYFTDFSTT